MSGAAHPRLARLASFSLICLLSLASTAFTAEVSAAEVDLVRNDITVSQGATVSFTVEVRASGAIRCAASPTNPATAVYHTAFALDEFATQSSGAPATAHFFATPPVNNVCRVTWNGDPTPHLVPMTLTVDRNLPLGDSYAITLRAATSTPPGTGETLRDEAPTVIKVHVVAPSDTTPPTVICGDPQGTQGSDGWYRSDVTHACTATDGESGLADQADEAFTLSTTGEGTELLTASRTVHDLARNSTTVGPFGPYRIDKTPPSIAIQSPADGATYFLGATATASYTCGDALSGAVSCTGNVASGGRLDTATVGSKVLRLEALDAAGNTTTVERKYSVIYKFTGFLPPAKDGALVHAGSSVPVKWSLNGVSDMTSFVSASSAAVDCNSVPSSEEWLEPIETPGNSSLVYDPIADQYVLVWKTMAEWTGCRRLTVLLKDETSHHLKVRMSSTGKAT